MRARPLLQAPASVVMIRPHGFAPNPETRHDNAFQGASAESPQTLAARARAEHDAAVTVLREAGVTVHVFDDTGTDTPDSVFPNNWFSTHPGGQIGVYPMFAANRRRERRADVIDLLKARYRVQDVIDLSGLEYDGLALEGTGAMVLDHLGRVAYVAQSRRASPVALERFSAHFGYEPMVFEAADASGQPVYHTNVLMCIATDFALVGLDMITDPGRRQIVVERLTETGHDVIALSPAQIADFAGNALELTGRDGRLLVLSRRAHAALTEAQRARIEASAQLLPIDLPTIELAGGSARCMIAGVHVSPRPQTPETPK